jgi:predicted transcriptional regulator
MKIISIDNKNVLNGINISAKQNILLPCYMFTISVPKEESKSLDIINETILRLCEYEKNPNRIADFCCIDKELVKFIQDRLYHSEYLTEKYELSSKGKKLLDELEESKQKELEYEAATILFDLVSGNVVKKIFRNNAIDRYVAFGEETEKDVIFYTERKEKIKAKLLKSGKKYEKIDENIIGLIKRKIVKICKKKGQISIQENPEMVYLHCVAVFQKGNNEDLLITDGIGKRFSGKFADSIRANSEKYGFIIRMLEGSINKDFSNLSETEKEKREGFLANTTPYPEISRRMKKCEEYYYSKSQENINSKNSEKDDRDRLNDCVTSLYDALEWTFWQIAENYPVGNAKNMLATLTPDKNAELLYDISEKLKYDIPKGLLNVPAGKFKQEKNPVEMRPMIALCILGANENIEHPLNIITKNFPELFKKIYKLQNIRNTNKHGKYWDIDKEMAMENFNYFKEIIEKVFPEALKYRINDVNKSDVQIDNERAKAKADILKYFGGTIKRKELTDMSKNLEKMFIIKENLTEDNFGQYIVDLSACLQNAIYLLYKEKPVNRDDGSEITKEECLKKMVDSKFIESKNAISNALKNTRQDRFEKSLNKKDDTLQSNLLALFALLEIEELNELSEAAPNLVKITGKIAELRGHGNFSVISMRVNNDNRDIAEQALKTIKQLLEVEL